MAQQPGRIPAFDGDLATGHLTYAEAARAALSFAEHMRNAGLRKPDKVIFWGENRPEWVVALWGCLLEGIVVTPIDFRSSPATVRTHRRHCRCQGAPHRTRSDRTCGSALPRLADAQRARSPTRGSGARPIPADPADLAEILFTSGATGEPKGVTITHRNILANLRPIDHGIEKYRKYMGPFKPIRFLTCCR